MCHNIVYKTLRVKYLSKNFCFVSAFVSTDSDEVRNSQSFIHTIVCIEEHS